MMEFAEILKALKQGESVRLANWGKTTRMYVSGKQFMCQVGDASPYQYDLSWHEIKAKKWSVLPAA